MDQQPFVYFQTQLFARLCSCVCSCRARIPLPASLLGSAGEGLITNDSLLDQRLNVFFNLKAIILKEGKVSTRRWCLRPPVISIKLLLHSVRVSSEK